MHHRDFPLPDRVTLFSHKKSLLGSSTTADFNLESTENTGLSEVVVVCSNFIADENFFNKLFASQKSYISYAIFRFLFKVNFWLFLFLLAVVIKTIFLAVKYRLIFFLLFYEMQIGTSLIFLVRFLCQDSRMNYAHLRGIFFHCRPRRGKCWKNDFENC